MNALWAELATKAPAWDPFGSPHQVGQVQELGTMEARS